MSGCLLMPAPAAPDTLTPAAGAWTVAELHERPELAPAWDAYVAAAPPATLFHTLGWRDAVRAAFRHTPHYLVALGPDGQAGGVLPLFKVHSLLAGDILVSVPYGVYGGIVADDPQAATALLDAAEKLAVRSGARYVELRSMTPLCPDWPVVRRYATFRKALPERAGDVLATLPRKARAECRKARQSGLAVRFGDEQLAVVWNLYAQSMRRLGSPNLPRRFFEAVLAATPEAHLVSAIYHQGRAVAGLVSLIHRDTVLPYYSGYIPAAAAGLGVNNYLYLTLMEEAVGRGLRCFDFGRTRLDNTGPLAFKKNQGFDPLPLNYQFWMPDGGPVPNLTPSNRRYHVAQRVWRRLPLMITRPLGEWLSSSIPG